MQNALPDARILYVSATGATTVPGLAYARRLGLWGGADTGGETPFEQRTDFVTAMEAGGVAAMEVVARDLKALGLYQARALSYDGVEVEPLEHPLTPEQRRIYDAYAGAFKVIHRNIEDALKATGIMEGDATLNKNAKSAALSAFEGACQWRSKKGPPRRCKKGPLGGCGLVPVVHGRAPRATRRALNRLTRRRAREGPVGPRGQAWAGWSVQLAVGV